jgi:hypothetical protein
MTDDGFHEEGAVRSQRAEVKKVLGRGSQLLERSRDLLLEAVEKMEGLLRRGERLDGVEGLNILD